MSVVAALLVASASAAAQPPAQPPEPASASVGGSPPISEATVAGQVLRVTVGGERPVPRQWVVLHGIGVNGGRAIDSTQSSATGDFRMRYARGADSTMQYFVSTVHHGIAYVSGILPPAATGDEATLTVYDTTSAALPLTVRGRHLLLFAPSDGPSRRVAEIYDLSNDTTLTRVTSDSGPPVWTGVIPAGFEEFSSGPEISSNESIRVVDGRVAAFAPVAPGLKRLAFTYSLPPKAFPASFHVEQPTELLEILLEDQQGAVEGAGLTEVSPSTIEGRTFRRFQAQGVAGGAVVTIRVPAATANGSARTTVPIVVVAGLMAIALIIALRRRRGAVAVARPIAVPVEDPTEALARQIAELDAEFARRPDVGEAERADYERRRESLKKQLAARLAPHRGA
jgi:hypothetical protein